MTVRRRATWSARPSSVPSVSTSEPTGVLPLGLIAQPWFCRAQGVPRVTAGTVESGSEIAVQPRRGAPLHCRRGPQPRLDSQPRDAWPYASYGILMFFTLSLPRRDGAPSAFHNRTRQSFGSWARVSLAVGFVEIADPGVALWQDRPPAVVIDHEPLRLGPRRSRELRPLVGRALRWIRGTHRGVVDGLTTR